VPWDRVPPKAADGNRELVICCGTSTRRGKAMFSGTALLVMSASRMSKMLSQIFWMT